MVRMVLIWPNDMDSNSLSNRSWKSALLKSNFSPANSICVGTSGALTVFWANPLQGTAINNAHAQQLIRRVVVVSCAF